MNELEKLGKRIRTLEIIVIAYGILMILGTLLTMASFGYLRH